MRKILWGVCLLLGVSYGEDALLSSLKQELLETKRQKAMNDALLEEQSWISPLTLSATIQNTKETTNLTTQSRSVGLSWSQDIFRSGGIEALIDKARASGRMEILGVDLEQAQYLKEVYTYLVKVRRDTLAVRQDTLRLKNSAIDLEIIKKQYEVGNKDITDLNRAILDKDTAQTTLIVSQTTLKNEVLELKKLIGEKDTAGVEIPSFPLLPKEEYLARHLELKQYQAQIQRDDASYRVTRSDYLPKLTLNTSVGYNEYGANALADEGDSYSYGVSMSMPIDYSTQEALQSQKLQVLQSKTASLDRRAELENVYKSALWNIKAYEEKIKVAQEMKRMYETLYCTTKAQEESGMKSSYDTESIENSTKVQELEVQIHAYNILIEKIGLYFDIEH